MPFITHRRSSTMGLVVPVLSYGSSILLLKPESVMRVFVWHFNVDDGTKLRLRQQDLYKKHRIADSFRTACRRFGKWRYAIV